MKQDRAFFDRATLEVAPDLIGQCLLRCIGADTLVGRIVEVEAYLGHPDAASHASRKNPKRAKIMFGPPGYAYVYMIYGMHCCFNFVTEGDGEAGAVLVRAVEPVEGVEVMRRLRTRPMPDRNLTSGPGKFCQAFGIDRTCNGIDVCGDELWIEELDRPPERVATGPRVGIGYAGEWALKPWRFWEAGNPFVSRGR